MSTSTSSPRSLTQMLRERDDASLERLLLDRPDLAFPPPAHLSDVASRCTTRHSVSRALAALNAFEVWVAHQVVAQPGLFSLDEVDELTRSDDADVARAAVVRLVDLGLVWGNPVDLTSLRPVRAMSAVLENEKAPERPPSTPPELTCERRKPTVVDTVASGSAFEFVRRMDVLLEHCDHRPMLLRRDGGMSTREVRAIANLIDVPSDKASTMANLARRAGLLGLGSDRSHEVLLPTVAFDDWQRLSLAHQWAVVVDTWFNRHPDSGAPWLKRTVLEAFGDPAEGYVVERDGVIRWVDWHRPRRQARTDRAVTTMLDQAGWIGITGLGAVASFAATIDADALDQLFPTRVGHVLVQADLTAIAPGPLSPDAAHDLGTIADIESRGGATVYRISPESLGRAYGLGWGVDEILATLRSRSRTPLPQALEYLVQDLDRRLPAPTEAVTARVHRNPERGTPVSDDDDATAEDRMNAALAAELVAGLRRAGEPSRRVASPDRDSTEHLFDSPLATLREAVETGEVVWVGYVDPTGSSSERLVRARILDDGLLRARDTRSDEEFSVAVHRITAAHIIRAGT